MNKNAKRLLIVFITLLMLYSVELVYLYKRSIIINVDGVNITKPQYDKLFAKNANASGFAMLGIDIAKDKKSFIYMLIKDKTVDDLIKQTLLDEEIKKKDIKAKTEDLREKKLAESVAKLTVTDSEVMKYYQENLNKFQHEATVRVSHIFVLANRQQIKNKIATQPENFALKGNEVQAKVQQELSLRMDKAKKLLAEVKANPSLFKQVAKQNSDDKTSADKGGDLGYVARSQMSDEIAKIVFTIQPNTVSEVVPTRNGYHILLVTDKKPATTDSFNKVKGQIVATLEAEKQKEILDNLATKLKKQAKIKYINKDYTLKSIEDRLNSSQK